MRTPEELDDVDWSALHHAYAVADDVPGMVRALYSGDTERIDTALGELYGKVLHQSTVYEATVAVIPFLAHAAGHITHRRADLLDFLVGAAGDREPDYPEAQRGRAEVAACVPHLLPFLTDDDVAVRRAVVRIGAQAVGPDVPAAIAALAACHTADPSPQVRADALTALAQLETDAESAERRLTDALRDRAAAVRTTAALTLMARTGTPYPAQLVRILKEAGAVPDGGIDRNWFPDVGSTDRRAADVLEADPDTAVAVSRHWIRHGDIGARGSDRAKELAGHWRDRQDETLELLLEALPHQRDDWALATRLRAIALWLPTATRPLPGLGDVLLTHATSTQWQVGEAAQLALGRLGDERLLTAVPEPDAQAVAALAARTGERDHQRRALTDPGLRYPLEILSALTARDAGALLPELTWLLRTHPAAGRVARRIGDWGLRDRAIAQALTDAARNKDQDLAIPAAVAHARLHGDADRAIELLTPQLSTPGGHWHLESAGLLGRAGAPLLPLVETFLPNSYDWTRMRAAEAHWRITGDPAVALPVLTEVAVPAPVGIAALGTLVEIGVTPPELRPRLTEWAHSPRRVCPAGWHTSFSELRPEDDRLRELSLRLLT
ncbi:hypothetical protein [Streptomyces sp. NPDC026673]|uniref:hypothetical protein n=1 Tax=Streptomyces sp. NPDC026673 TaxID=3155724 RepID=UPI0033CE988B